MKIHKREYGMLIKDQRGFFQQTECGRRLPILVDGTLLGESNTTWKGVDCNLCLRCKK